MFPAERLDPHAPGVVKMPGDHAHGASRRSRNGGIPECGGQLLDQVRRDPAVGSPRGQERRAQIGGRNHLYQRTRTFTAARLLNPSGADSPRSAPGGVFDASYSVVRPGIRASIPVPIAAYTPGDTRNRDARLPGQPPPARSPGQSAKPAVTNPRPTPTMAPMMAPLRSESPRRWIRVTRAASNRRSAPPTRITIESGFRWRSLPEVSAPLSSRT